MAKKRFFTVKEINALLPTLETTLAQVAIFRQRMAMLDGRLKEKSLSDVPVEVAEAQMLRAQSIFMANAIEDNIEHITSLGGIVKDLDQGLVDFPGHVRGQPAWLCWKKGEGSILFWHALDEGFAQRQFLNSEIRSTLH